ncbi:MAG: hypothetical protein LUD50_04565 [Clostridia bacterium]|nr:hypothetical protein [Clostridia bacterium]
MRSTDRLTTMDKTGEIHPKGMREGKWKVCKNCTVYGEMAALIEQQAYRDGHRIDETWEGPDGKPEGVPTELADCVIRIMDLFEQYGMDLEDTLKAKNSYNATREYRHGGKVI